MEQLEKAVQTQDLAKTYDPKQVEEKWYARWEERGYFQAVGDGEREPFSIVIPPPNVTGSLHMGHALNNTLQDILVRWKRMQGYDTLWLPGTDHAGIATQIKVEEELREWRARPATTWAGRPSSSRVWEWKEHYRDRIVGQLKKLGVSCDWSRERFTMDEGCSRAVREVFVHLYNKGLIYKGRYIINWCPHCHTTLSDLEVEHEEVQGKHLAHPLPATRTGDGYIVGGDDAARDDAGRHGGGRPPRGRALPASSSADACVLPLMDREIPDRRRRVRRPGVRHGHGQGDARPRPQRLRDRPAPRPRADPGDRR